MDALLNKELNDTLRKVLTSHDCECVGTKPLVSSGTVPLDTYVRIYTWALRPRCCQCVRIESDELPAPKTRGS